MHRTVTIPMWRTVRTETPSIHLDRDGKSQVNVAFDHRVPNGELTGTVELTIDLEAIFEQLGEKALRNKGGKATAQSGMIVARVRRETIRRTGKVS